MLIYLQTQVVLPGTETLWSPRGGTALEKH